MHDARGAVAKRVVNNKLRGARREHRRRSAKNRLPEKALALCRQTALGGSAEITLKEGGGGDDIVLLCWSRVMSAMRRAFCFAEMTVRSRGPRPGDGLGERDRLR